MLNPRFINKELLSECQKIDLSGSKLYEWGWPQGKMIVLISFRAEKIFKFLFQ